MQLFEKSPHFEVVCLLDLVSSSHGKYHDASQEERTDGISLDQEPAEDSLISQKGVWGEDLNLRVRSTDSPERLLPICPRLPHDSGLA
jgi:hypothetical protein